MANEFVVQNGLISNSNVVVSGSVGIGTDSPSTNLHIEGENNGEVQLFIKGTHATTAEAGIKFQTAELGTASWGIGLNEQDKFFFTREANNPISMTDAGALMVIDSSGNVGIGTEAPATELHIYRNSTDGHAAIRSETADLDKSASVEAYSDTAQTYILAHGSSYAGTIAGLNRADMALIEANLASSLIFTTVNSATAPIVFAPGRSEKMRIDSTGNVGIGTTNPLVALSVKGDAIRLYDDVSDDIVAGLIQSADDGGLELRANNVTKIQLWANSNSYFNGGNVGIGTTSPSQKLHVVSDTNYEGIFINGSTPNINFVLGLGTTPAWKVGISGNNGNNFAIGQATSTDRFTINPDGEVGIGVTPIAGIRAYVNGVLTVNTPLLPTSMAAGIVLGNSTAPSAGIVDGISFYSKDLVAGNSVPHFRTENNTVIILDQSLDTAASPTFAGITETDGVLKQNLLTNSGFGVWSNSTLENVTVSGLAPDNCATSLGTEVSGTTGWTNNGMATFEASSTRADDGTYSLHITGDGGDTQDRTQMSFTTVVGKLYRIKAKAWVTNEDADTKLRVIVGYASNANEYYNNLDFGGASWNELDIVIEAATTTTYLGFKVAGGNYDPDVYIDSVSAYEVTPGCVAADILAMDGWEKSGIAACKIYREHHGTNTRKGSFYSLRMRNTSSFARYFRWPLIVNDPVHVAKFEGRTVTLGCWVKTSTASEARIQISTSASDTPSATHTGGGDWEWLELTRTIEDSVSLVAFYFVSLGISADETTYWSQPMLVFGNSIGEGNYTSPPGEIIWFEKEVGTEYASSSISVDTDVNIEATTKGKLPKSIAAVSMRMEGTTGGANHLVLMRTKSGGPTGLKFVILTVNALHSANGWQPASSTGDMYIDVSATTFSGFSIFMQGVQMR